MNETGLEDGQYEIVIDTSFKDGNLDYGELVLRAKIGRNILIDIYLPSFYG